ncbi:MAG: hypothetical protein O7A67_00100, partial [SAR324 cluster bacterium]|nr:hypothetical protein [SAR324 cluster bacterium]
AVHWERDDAAQIERQWRAYTPWPGSYGFLEGKRLEFVRMEGGTPPAALLEPEPQPGTLLRDGWVAAREGFLRLVEVKPEGKRAMAIRDFLNGQPQALGMRLTPERPP